MRISGQSACGSLVRLIASAKFPIPVPFRYWLRKPSGIRPRAPESRYSFTRRAPRQTFPAGFTFVLRGRRLPHFSSNR